MKFLIEIEGKTQPELISALDEVRKRLLGGGCFLTNYKVCKLMPENDAAEDEFRKQYRAAHPKSTASWIEG